MPTLLQLEQLISINQYATLSLAALHLHISQPALSRSMKKLEETMQGTLFERQKNKITPNENGKLVVTYAKKILHTTKTMITTLQTIEKHQHSLFVGSMLQPHFGN